MRQMHSDFLHDVGMAKPLLPIPQAIRDAANDRRLTTQPEIANAIGASQSTVSRWLQGGEVGEEFHDRLAAFLGMDDHEFVALLARQRLSKLAPASSLELRADAWEQQQGQTVKQWRESIESRFEEIEQRLAALEAPAEHHLHAADQGQVKGEAKNVTPTRRRNK